MINLMIIMSAVIASLPKRCRAHSSCFAYMDACADLLLWKFSMNYPFAGDFLF
jgi:hypothetical protein